MTRLVSGTLCYLIISAMVFSNAYERAKKEGIVETNGDVLLLMACCSTWPIDLVVLLLTQIKKFIYNLTTKCMIR